MRIKLKGSKSALRDPRVLQAIADQLSNQPRDLKKVKLGHIQGTVHLTESESVDQALDLIKAKANRPHDFKGQTEAVRAVTREMSKLHRERLDALADELTSALIAEAE